MLDSTLVKPGQVYKHKITKREYVIHFVGVDCRGILCDKAPSDNLIIYGCLTGPRNVAACATSENRFHGPNAQFVLCSPCPECFKPGSDHKLSCNLGRIERQLKGNHEKPC